MPLGHRLRLPTRATDRITPKHLLSHAWMAIILSGHHRQPSVVAPTCCHAVPLCAMPSARAIASSPADRRNMYRYDPVRFDILASPILIRCGPQLSPVRTRNRTAPARPISRICDCDPDLRASDPRSPVLATANQRPDPRFVLQHNSRPFQARALCLPPRITAIGRSALPATPVHPHLSSCLRVFPSSWFNSGSRPPRTRTKEPGTNAR